MIHRRAMLAARSDRADADIDAALTDDARADGATAASLALHTQVVLQGTFVVSKAANDPTVAVGSIEHLRRYLTTMLESAT